MSVTEPRSERRRSSRSPLHLEVEIGHLDTADLAVGVSQDVSVGGIRVRTDASLRGPVFVVMGKSGRVFATVGRVLASTTVAGRRANEIRIQFDDGSPERTSSLGRFLDQLRTPAGPEPGAAGDPSRPTGDARLLADHPLAAVPAPQPQP